MEVIKEVITQNKLYKAQIIKRTDGLFSDKIFRWYEDEWDKCWSPITRWLSLMDTSEHAIKNTLEELRNFTGEDIIL